MDAYLLSFFLVMHASSSHCPFTPLFPPFFHSLRLSIISTTANVFFFSSRNTLHPSISLHAIAVDETQEQQQRVRAQVQDYYGKTLQTTDDLKTNACCTAGSPPKYIQEAISKLQYVRRFYERGYFGSFFPLFSRVKKKPSFEPVRLTTFAFFSSFLFYRRQVRPPLPSIMVAVCVCPITI
jgi:hypothetical protein